MNKKEFDAVVVGSGPNGLSAAITLQQAGLSVLVLEAKSTVGGGLRSAELTLPGFTHDICSAIHPLAFSSPFFKTLPLKEYGLEYIFPSYALAHPFEDGPPSILQTSLLKTAETLGTDEESYIHLISPLLKNWEKILPVILGPLHLSDHPFKLMQFATKAFVPASKIIDTYFGDRQGRGLFAGLAAHSMLPLNFVATSAIALVLLLLAHGKGWPLVKGGSASLAHALASYFTSIGGKVQTNFPVRSLGQLPSCDAILFDVSPIQLLEIAGHKFSSFYKWQLRKYRYGMGVFKIDWALDEAIPFTAGECRLAATIHLGNTGKEIMQSEKMAWEGRHCQNPFVIFVQPSVFDNSRAFSGKHTAWAYCHVPRGSTTPMTEFIENQVERFAPGFRQLILGRHVMNSEDLEAYNANYVGGDINGGAQDIKQLFTRPAIRFSPYRTSARGIYLCSASTPPGGGVHGMCGYHAAKRALKDVFKIKLPADKST